MEFSIIEGGGTNEDLRKTNEALVSQTIVIFMTVSVQVMKSCQLQSSHDGVDVVTGRRVLEQVNKCLVP